MSIMQTEYNDMVKVCPLRHCSNCGSLKLQTHKKRSFQTLRAKQNFVLVLPPLGFFVLVYGYLFVRGDLISFLSILAIYSVFFIGILLKTTLQNVDCKECNARNFPFVDGVNINPDKSNAAAAGGEDLTKKKSPKQFLRDSKEQKRHNKKDIVIGITGAVSLIVIATLGTFLVNPDDVLVGEVIDLIKSAMN